MGTSIVLPELIACGVYNSRVAQKGVKKSKRRNITMFEIEMPIKNGGRSVIDEDVSPISTDRLICAKPNQTRSTVFPFMCYYIHLIVNEGAIYDILINMPNFIETKNRAKYAELFNKIAKYSGTGIKSDELAVQSNLLELIFLLNKDAVIQSQKINGKNGNKNIIENALKYIEKNLSGDLSLNKVSKSVSLSPVYFHNVFKSATGMTLHDYVEERRIKKAVDYLVSTNMTLTQVAFECGFSSQSYFSYAFKRRMKITPRGYVKTVYKNYDI